MSAPNIYNLRNSAAGIHVIYSTGAGGAIGGLQYQDSSQTLQFKTTDLQTVASDMGSIVTATLRRTIDTGSTTFTLVVPTVNLSPSRISPVATFGVTTVHQFSTIAAFNQGQLETYSIVDLQGTAEFIAF
jgi:hypothetical protein